MKCSAVKIALECTEIKVFQRKTLIKYSSLSVSHVRRTSELTDELGITLGDQSTSSVRKRANAHWHAIIATAALRYSVGI